MSSAFLFEPPAGATGAVGAGASSSSAVGAGAGLATGAGAGVSSSSEALAAVPDEAAPDTEPLHYDLVTMEEHFNASWEIEEA